jgi:hypothetical protein
VKKQAKRAKRQFSCERTVGTSARSMALESFALRTGRAGLRRLDRAAVAAFGGAMLS